MTEILIYLFIAVIILWFFAEKAFDYLEIRRRQSQVFKDQLDGTIKQIAHEEFGIDGLSPDGSRVIAMLNDRVIYRALRAAYEQGAAS